jgi:hypothetical protein
MDTQETMMGHEKAKTLIMVGGVVFLLTLITAAIKGELQRYLKRACGAERKLSRSLGHMMILVYITVSVSVPFMVYLTFFQLKMRPHDVAWITAFIFTLMTLTLSGEEIRKHLVNYSSPRVQKQ